MVFSRINKIRNPHHRRAVYGALSLHGIFLALVALKTLVFNIAGLKTLAYGSVFLMSLFDLVPHVALAQSTPQIDYSISNSVYPMFTQQGEMAIHMIYYQNDSNPYTAGTNVVVTVDIPVGMSYSSHEGPAYATRTDRQIVWNIPNGQSRNGMIILRLLVDPQAAGQLKTTATVSSANPDPVMTNNTSDAVILANGGTQGNVDLAINTTVNRSTATIFDTVDFTINYVNNGPDTAVGVKIYEVLPPELRIRTTSIPHTSRQNSIYTRDIGTLAPGQGGSISISTSIFPIVTDGSQFENTTVISSNIIENNTENNTSVFPITVQDSQSDMYVDIFATKQSICINENITFTVNLGNQGLGTANNISVRHTKPSTMTYVSSSKTNTIPSVGVYNWAYATPFNVGDSAAFTFTLKGYDAVVSQSIPIVVYENGVQVAQDTFAVTVLPQGMCTSTNTETNTGTGTNSGSTNPNPTIIYGCTNASATNYNSTATHDNGTCTYAPTTQPVYGCTSYLATNYNSAATHNDGTCIFVNPVYGCKNPAAINYNSKATVDNGQCILPTTTAKTGSTATGTTNTGTTQIPVPDTKKDDTTDIIAGKPSKTNFFVVNPSPKKTTKQPIAEVKKLTEKVTVVKAQIDMSDDKVFEEQLLKAMECEDTMVDIYNYASEAGLITKYDIKDLCGPITRIKFAGIMVKFMLNLAIIEPDLKRNCSFDDLAGLTNEEKFNAALACDFGIMGVDDNGKVLKSFKPNETVTKAVAAKALTNFVFGDTYKKALAGQAWYEPAMKILHESYVIRSVENPAQEMLLGHVLLMLKRVDFGELVKQTKYIILRNRK